MGAALWTMFAVAAVVGIFAACTVAVVIGVRIVEQALAKHHDRRPS